MNALLLATLLACGSDESADLVTAYHQAMTPPVNQNRELTQLYLELTTQLKNEKLDEAGLVRTWEEQVLPKADGLKAEVTSIQPENPQLAEVHAQVVAAWTQRASAYHGMHDAWKTADASAFDASFKEFSEAKALESAYFADANSILGAYGLRLEQFP